MSKYVVLKPLPNFRQPGEIVDLNDDEAGVFLLPGVDAIRQAVPSDERKTPQQRLRARDYNRRDMVAVDAVKSED